MNKLYFFLDWLRDPFGNKRLSERHHEIRKRMMETKTRTEVTTEIIRNYPIGHTLKRRRPTPTTQPTTKGARP